MYFLDTNICVYLLNAKYPRLDEFYASRDKKSIKIPSVVLYELRYGAEKSRKRLHNIDALNNFLLGLEIVPFDEHAAEIAGKIRAKLEHSGNVIGGNDVLIAATVLANGGIAVTNNVREFSRVPGLVVEDWTTIL